MEGKTQHPSRTPVNTPDAPPPRLLARTRGCLLGGALGDALGAPVEFLPLDEIRKRHGPRGVTGLEAAWGRRGAVTDDTQMTLFTAEGLIRAWVRGEARGICHPPSVVWHAYLRWLSTQGEPWQSAGQRFFDPESPRPDGWLVRESWLHSRRAPGATCLAALRSHRMGELRRPLNDSKGCGGVMRVAPAGLVDGAMGGDRFTGDSVDYGQIFTLGCELAAITHGHPSGYYPAGALAVAVQALLRGVRLEPALDFAQRALRPHHDASETENALLKARRLASREPGSVSCLESLGRGWTGEEALAIGVYAAASYPEDPREAMLLAVNHSGDSDSTGSICGHLLGALLGEEALPEEWLAELEGRSTIERLADDLCRQVTGCAPRPDDTARGEAEYDAWLTSYPGW